MPDSSRKALATAPLLAKKRLVSYLQQVPACTTAAGAKHMTASYSISAQRYAFSKRQAVLSVLIHMAHKHSLNSYWHDN
jgi:hypothetical protein